ncbi:MAG: PA2779 family protein, partial [Desulfobacterales bacterium]
MMKVFRSKAQFLSIFMTVLMLLVSIPCQSVLAAIIGTETVLDSVRGQEARDQLKQFLSREEVRSALIAQGVDPMEA